MRMKRSRLKEYKCRKSYPKKDKEGNSYIEYGPPTLFIGEIWPAGGKIQAEMYGQKVAGMRNGRIVGNYNIKTDPKGNPLYEFEGFTIQENDGVCIDSTDEPDYRVVAIKPYRALYLEMERI